MFTSLKNNKGLTLVEIMVSMAIGLTLLSVAVYTFTHQQTTLRDQNADAMVRAQGRLAINKISKDLRNAGAGVPVTLKFETASATVFKYKVNPDDGPTPVAANITSTNTVITLTNTTNFTAGQNVVLYILGELHKAIPTVPNFISSVASVDAVAKTVTLNTAVAADYNAFATVINSYDTITYTHDTVNNRITRTVNGTTYPFIENVTGLTFTYKNKNEANLGNPVTAANLRNIRKVEVFMTFQDPQVANASVNLRTDVYIRNTDDDV